MSDPVKLSRIEAVAKAITAHKFGDDTVPAKPDYELATVAVNAIESTDESDRPHNIVSVERGRDRDGDRIYRAFTANGDVWVYAFGGWRREWPTP